MFQNTRLLRTSVFILILVLIFNSLSAQRVGLPLTGQTEIKDYSVYAKGAASLYDTTTGVLFRNSVNINRGGIGSNSVINVGQNNVINAALYSGNVVNLLSGNQINGHIVTRNDNNSTNPVLFTNGANNTFGNDDFTEVILSAGNVSILSTPAAGPNTVYGPVRILSPFTYSGPTPGFNPPEYVANIDLPILPVMPSQTIIGAYGTTNITGSANLNPGSYGDINLSGDATITFTTPGIYIFKSIKAQGINTIDFEIPEGSSNNYRIYVHEDVSLGAIETRINGFGPDDRFNNAQRIYLEVQGDGSTGTDGNAFHMRDEYGNTANWAGTVFAPNGDIEIDDAIWSTRVDGALYSNSRIVLGTDVQINHEPFDGDFTFLFIEPLFPVVPNHKVGDKIGAELTSINANPSVITGLPIFQADENGNVVIEVIAMNFDNSALRAFLEAEGGILITYSPIHLTLTYKFPIAKLLLLNEREDIDYVRPLYNPLNNSIVHAGDTSMRSNLVRSQFGLDGNGIKVGVISDSYNSITGDPVLHDITEGYLPGAGNPNGLTTPVEVLRDQLVQRKDEGRAMLQLVHAVVPKATLAFRTGFNNAVDFALGIGELATAGCDVIVDDLTYITEPFFKDGVVSQAVDGAVASGVSYFTSAGNFGARSYEGVFLPSATPLPSGINATGVAHQFANGTHLQRLSLKQGQYLIVLQWEDNVFSLGGNPGAVNDLDLYLVDDLGNPLFGFNRNNIIGDPLEIIPFVVNADTEANLMVVRAGGTANMRFKFIIFQGDGTILGNIGGSTVVGHANSNGAISVGAMLYSNPAILPNFPAESLPDTYPSVASFSSRGGIIMSGEGTARLKPDIIAPNGVNTTVDLGGVDVENDNIRNFFGTSAAAPHAAGVAALIIEARKKFNLDESVTPDEIKTLLLNTALPFAGQSGHSFENGRGYVQADKAILDIANAAPIVNTLETLSGTPATTPVRVKVSGQYLTAGTQIYFDGAAISNSVVSSDRTFVEGDIPVFDGSTNPPVQLYNPPKSPSGLDGGLSNPKYLLGEKITVIVKADNKTKKYGEPNPPLTFTATVNGVPVTDATVPSLSQLALVIPEIEVETVSNSVDESSNVNVYGIRVGRPEGYVVPAPISNAFDFVYQNGSLVIQKQTLKIKPLNKTVRYGQDLGVIEYDYVFGNSIDNDVAAEIKSLHKNYIANNALAVVNGYATSNRSITDLALKNMSLMASYQSLANARKFSLTNGQLQPLVNGSQPDYTQQRHLIDLSAQSLYKYAFTPSIAELMATQYGQTGLLSARSLAEGKAKAGFPNGQLQAMVNGQLMAMVNGQLMAIVNGQLQAIVNEGGSFVNVVDITYQNGQLMAIVNAGESWQPIQKAQVTATVNGQSINAELTIVNGQLQAMVNGQLMAMVNGQLQAIVNGQLLGMVNGQLMAMVNGQLMPMVNGQLMAMVNGQLQAIVNGVEVDAQHVVLYNGQLQAMVNGVWKPATNATYTTIVNGSQAEVQISMVNGQLQAMVNGQLLGMVNGQLQGMVNGQLMAIVNGQLLAIVNGQLMAIVNGEVVLADYVEVAASGQLQAMVNGQLMPMVNGQLLGMVNGQLMAMVNGQLMAIVNTNGTDRLTFATLVNGQLQAMVNGQLQAMVNGQLMAMVNGELIALNGYTITNGQLQAIVNGVQYQTVNGQLQAMVNGQLQAMVNNSGNINAANNGNAAVIIDANDLNVQYGYIGGMVGVNLITGLDVGKHKLYPATFVHPNFDISYDFGEVEITPSILTVVADSKPINQGAPTPTNSFFTSTIKGLAYNDGPGIVSGIQYALSPNYTGAIGSTYTITPSNAVISSQNYNHAFYQNGTLYVNPYGKGAKKIVIKRICVQELTPAEVAQYGYKYKATFSYTNNNTTAVYIPRGEDNLIQIDPGGIYENTLPEFFAKGTHEITIRFSGHQMFWQLRSMESAHKTAITADVNKNAQKCNSPKKAEVEEETQIEVQVENPIAVYPNPAKDRVRINIGDKSISEKELVVYDAIGKVYPSVSVKRIDHSTFELNVAMLQPGLYIVKLKTKEGYKTVRFTKL